MIHITRADPLSVDSRTLIEKLSVALATLTGSSGKHSFNIDDVQADRALWVLAYDEQGVAVGCGAIRPLSAETAELKRMFALHAGKGIGSSLLRYLEQAARELGYHEMKLETRRVNHPAVAFYEKQGYRQTGNYGRYIGRPEVVCFVKVL
ncbi:GNAT family N-acetyltransferase [Yokenella regensburgei]|uniref:GNAT family N-acetyltransferase n=1 Tax=Yokenella regensburgei TaxID=158877 RepID=UPI003F144AC1